MIEKDEVLDRNISDKIIKNLLKFQKSEKISKIFRDKKIGANI